VNCVGILDRGLCKNTFDAIQASNGVMRICALVCSRRGASAGSDLCHRCECEADSDYAQTKAMERGRALLKIHARCVILAPLDRFRAEHWDFSTVCGMTRIRPCDPFRVGGYIVSGRVYVDRRRPAAKSCGDEASPAGIYELGDRVEELFAA